MTIFSRLNLIRSSFFLLSAFISGLPARKLVVVTSTTDLRSITEAVGGEYVSVTAISSGRQDPHYIAAKPSFMLRLRNADLFIRIGLQLELAWERLVLEGSRNRRIQLGSPGHLDASAGIPRLEKPTGAVDRSMGDIHPEGNPHYWLDPYNARTIAVIIAERLGELDPGHRAAYERNAAAFVRRVDEAMFGSLLRPPDDGPNHSMSVPGYAGEDPERLWALQGRGELAVLLRSSTDGMEGLDVQTMGWYGAMLAARGTHVITYHRSWSYFFNRFGMVSMGELESKPGIAPSPGHLSRIIESVKQKRVPLLIVATFKGKQAPAWVASKTGITVLRLPYSVGGNKHSPDYFALMNYLVGKISSVLAARAEEEES